MRKRRATEVTRRRLFFTGGRHFEGRESVAASGIANLTGRG